MNVTPIIFFDMIAAILILAVAVVIVVLYSSRTTKRFHEDPKFQDDLQDNASSLDEARIKAIKIVDDANRQALDIVNKVTLSTNLTSENFKQEASRISAVQIEEFEKKTSDFTKTYFQVLQDLKTKNIEIFQNISKDIEINTMAELESFKESMRKLTTLSQKEVKKKTDIDYEAAKNEIENYKKEEFEKINSKIYELLETTAKLVLGKAINLTDHEDLIKKSLERAKKEGTFK